MTEYEEVHCKVSKKCHAKKLNDNYMYDLGRYNNEENGDDFLEKLTY